MKTKNLTFFFILFLIFFISCKNNDSGPSYKDINIVTGLNAVDDNGQPIGQWMSANENPGNVTTFPNPARNFVFVASQETIVRVWLIPADCLIDNTADIPTLSLSLSYDISTLEEIQIKDISVTDFIDSMTLDVSDVSSGFYKLFYETEAGDLFWKNMYITDSNSTSPQFPTDFDALCD